MLTRWLFSTNAKDIGTLYLYLRFCLGFLSTVFSIFIRLELHAPDNSFLMGDHQNLVLWLAIIPLILGLINYSVPFLVGVSSTVLPRISLSSLIGFFTRNVLLLVSVLMRLTFGPINITILLTVTGLLYVVSLTLRLIDIVVTFSIYTLNSRNFNKSLLVWLFLIVIIGVLVCTVFTMYLDSITLLSGNITNYNVLDNVSFWLLSASEPEDKKFFSKLGEGAYNVGKGLGDRVSNVAPPAVIVSGRAKIASSVKGPPAVKLGTLVGGMAVNGLGYMALKNGIKASDTSTTLRSAQQVNDAYTKLNRPSSPENPFFAPSPNESQTSFFDNLLSWLGDHLLPTSVKSRFDTRVPTPLESLEGQYNVLFAQYNYIIYVIYLLVVVIMFIIVFCVIVHYIKVYQSKIVSKFPISRFVVNWIAKNRDIIIVMNIFAIVFNLYSIYTGVSFLTDNYIPSSLGPLCDLVLNSINKS